MLFRQYRILLAFAWAATVTVIPSEAQTVFINEIHYDNTGTDEGEFVEIAGPAGTDLTNWKIVFYNGNGGASYATVTLAGQIPDTCGGYGTFVVEKAGIQNGAPDGLALVDNSGGGDVVVQFISYEGVIIATDGSAIDLSSSDIGVLEESNTAIGQSLQLSGTGSRYTDFTWNTPSAITKGACNVGQTFSVIALPSVSLSVDVAEIAEASGTAQFAATLSVTSVADVIVYLTFDGTATRYTDYVDSGNAIVIPAGQLTGLFSIISTDDTIPEADETIRLTIDSVSPHAVVGEPIVAATTILDDDTPPVVTLTADKNHLEESGGSALIMATLSRQLDVPVTISLSFAGSATKNLDYTVSSPSITIPTNTSSGSIMLTPIQDANIEGNEIASVGIASVSVNATIGNPHDVSISITDDDTPTASLDVNYEQIDENGGVASISVKLSFIIPEAVTATLTFSGSATGGGIDYSTSGSDVTIPAFQGVTVLTVTAVDDVIIENNETIFVQISAVSPNAYIDDSSIRITILNDDHATSTKMGFIHDDAILTHDSGITLNEISTVSIVDFNADGQVDSVDDQDEFIEIVNSTPVPIDINGWVLGDNSGNYVFSGLAPIERPFSVTIFTRGADVSNFDPGPGNQVVTAPNLALDDVNDAVGLKNPQGLFIAIHWGTQSPENQLNADFLANATLVGADLTLVHNWIVGQSQTRIPTYTGNWDRHPVIAGNFNWSLNGSIALDSPSASPSRRLDGIPMDSGDKVEIPSLFGLGQNYPNPFNPITTITYTLPNPGDVRIEVFDLLGKRIRLLDSGFMPLGKHEITFDASGLSSGVYFYTLTAGIFSKTRKMVVVK